MNFEMQYQKLCHDLLVAKVYDYRNGKAATMFNQSITHDLANGFPLVTSRTINFDIIRDEFLWAIKGRTNVNELNSRIWDPFADKAGELGPIYGFQWTRWGDQYSQAASWERLLEQGMYTPINQLEEVLKHLKADPWSRRAYVSVWNVADLELMALPPCQPAFQLYRSDDGLNITVLARSADMALGFPYDFGMYSLMLYSFARRLKLPPRQVTFFMTNAHLYIEHFRNMAIQVVRKPLPLPNMLCVIHPSNKFADLGVANFQLSEYQHFPSLKYELKP